MPSSKHRKNHQQKLNKYKHKHMEQNQSTNQPLPQQLPSHRSVPVWDPQVDIHIKGYEWEVIYNFIGSSQVAAQAAQGVMSRNIVNGTIKMEFEKLDPQKLQYVEMTDEEKAPLRKQF